LSLYALAALHRSSIYSTEAGLKYFVLGAVSSGLRLYGISLIYGWTGTTQFGDLSLILAGGDMPVAFKVGVLLLFVGLFFKVGVVPFHQWVPDVYEGAPTIVTAFFAIVPKVVVLLVLARLLGFSFHDRVDSWSSVRVGCSLATVVLAAFAALSQRRRKRFFAYSAIGHVGYILMGFASGSIEGIQGVFFVSYYLCYYIYVCMDFFISFRTRKRKSCCLFLRFNWFRYSSPGFSFRFYSDSFFNSRSSTVSRFCREDICFLFSY
jgi:NADH-quinone oxidoreductase subunit N